jgi:hypothetical protein
MPCRRRHTGKALIAIAGILVLTAAARAQAPTAPAAAGESDEGPTIADSSVGYIDNAIPGSRIRLRADAAFDNRSPTRAEFFYAKGGVGNPGLPRPETKDDFQELTSYLELALRPRFSVFIESPVRFLQGDVNGDSAGFGDLNAGFKWAFVDTRERVITFQFRTYAPTGDAHRGLGNDHVSLEPALLFLERLNDRLRLEGELRYWAPIGGTDFAGDIVRYGIGISYGKRPADGCWVTPVVELVGWTVLDGNGLQVPVPGVTLIDPAAGDTIVNAKVGLRAGYGERGDLYVGYGRPLTGDTWYQDIVRMEFRLNF